MKIVLFVLLLIGLFSCSEYNQVLKSDDYQKKFELAESLYSKEKYARSIALYEQIYQRFPKTGEGELAYYRIGKSYYEVEDYVMGGYYLGSYTQRFPYSAKVEDALFLSAMCAVKNSPKHTLDPTDTELAINDLQLFVDKFPNSKLVDSCNYFIDRLRGKLELKEFEGVKLYSQTENFRAAVVAAETFIEKYLISQYREEVWEILIENSYSLAINSIESKKMERISETLERYSTFVIEFPNSANSKRYQNYMKELEKIKEEKQSRSSNP